MTFNFAQDWPVFIIVGLFAGFIVYAYFNGKKNSQKSEKK